MTGRALSEEAKRRQVLEATAKWEKVGVQIWLQERARPALPGQRKRKSLEAICNEINARCLSEDKVTIEITKSSLHRRCNGIPSQAETNQKKTALFSPEVEDRIVDQAIAYADQAFPLSKKRLEAIVISIGKAIHGEGFKLGHNWIDRFITRHRDRLRQHWSHGLDQQRAQCANPATKKDYFEKLKKVLEGEDGEEPIPPELIYGIDETGIQTGVGQKERVIGRTGSKVQQQQRSGNRENITVIVTICADGSSLAPAVIFKGKAFQTSWKQNNPLNASIGHSKKGWTDGEIGVQWIETFDKQTKEKANGRRRLLLVDGHNSHYTPGFLHYARDNKIDVLCYPPHSTHLYQGLDVVIFSPLKKAWSKYRDAYEQERGRISKSNGFLEVYGQAHHEALSPGNVIAAFRKTGVVPFDPNVVTDQMLAPSQASLVSIGLPPTQLATPVRVISDLIHATVARQAAQECDNLPTVVSSSQDLNPSALHTPVRRATSELSASSASFLVSPSAIRSTHTIPHFKPFTISPNKPRNTHLNEFQPTTEREAVLWAALKEAEERDSLRKEQMVAMQAQTVIYDVYVKSVKSQLQEAEERKQKPKGVAFGDGKSRLLTDAAFIEAADQRMKEKEVAEKEKEKQREKRATYSEALAAWRKADRERVERNNEIRRVHKEAVAAWKLEVATAKCENRRPEIAKPKKPTIESQRPRPTRGGGGEEGKETDDEEENDDEIDIDDSDD